MFVLDFLFWTIKAIKNKFNSSPHPFRPLFLLNARQTGGINCSQHGEVIREPEHTLEKQQQGDPGSTLRNSMPQISTKYSKFTDLTVCIFFFILFPTGACICLFKLFILKYYRSTECCKASTKRSRVFHPVSPSGYLLETLAQYPNQKHDIDKNEYVQLSFKHVQICGTATIKTCDYSIKATLYLLLTLQSHSNPCLIPGNQEFVLHFCSFVI